MLALNATVAELSSYNRDCITPRGKNIYYVAL